MSAQIYNDVVLQIGDFHFGDGHTRIRTLLGSCISISLWHPALKIGGMCHYLLPQCCSNGASYTAGEGNYAEGAMRLFMRELHRTHTRPQDYVVKLFGGGCMFTDSHESPATTIDRGEHPAAALNVAEKNVLAARRLLDVHGFRIAAEQVGGFGSRLLIFELWSGDVWVKRGGPLNLSDLEVAA